MASGEVHHRGGPSWETEEEAPTSADLAEKLGHDGGGGGGGGGGDDEEERYNILGIGHEYTAKTNFGDDYTYEDQYFDGDESSMGGKFCETEKYMCDSSGDELDDDAIGRKMREAYGMEDDSRVGAGYGYEDEEEDDDGDGGGGGSVERGDVGGRQASAASDMSLQMDKLISVEKLGWNLDAAGRQRSEVSSMMDSALLEMDQKLATQPYYRRDDDAALPPLPPGGRHHRRGSSSGGGGGGRPPRRGSTSGGGGGGPPQNRRGSMGDDSHASVGSMARIGNSLLELASLRKASKSSRDMLRDVEEIFDSFGGGGFGFGGGDYDDEKIAKLHEDLKSEEGTNPATESMTSSSSRSAYDDPKDDDDYCGGGGESRGHGSRGAASSTTSHNHRKAAVSRGTLNAVFGVDGASDRSPSPRTAPGEGRGGGGCGASAAESDDVSSLTGATGHHSGGKGRPRHPSGAPPRASDGDGDGKGYHPSPEEEKNSFMRAVAAAISGPLAAAASQRPELLAAAVAAKGGGPPRPMTKAGGGGGGSNKLFYIADSISTLGTKFSVMSGKGVVENKYAGDHGKRRYRDDDCEGGKKLMAMSHEDDDDVSAENAWWANMFHVNRAAEGGVGRDGFSFGNFDAWRAPSYRAEAGFEDAEADDPRASRHHDDPDSQWKRPRVPPGDGGDDHEEGRRGDGRRRSSQVSDETVAPDDVNALDSGAGRHRGAGAANHLSASAPPRVGVGRRPRRGRYVRSDRPGAVQMSTVAPGRPPAFLAALANAAAQTSRRVVQRRRRSSAGTDGDYDEENAGGSAGRRGSETLVVANAVVLEEDDEDDEDDDDKGEGGASSSGEKLLTHIDANCTSSDACSKSMLTSAQGSDAPLVVAKQVDDTRPMRTKRLLMIGVGFTTLAFLIMGIYVAVCKSMKGHHRGPHIGEHAPHPPGPHAEEMLGASSVVGAGAGAGPHSPDATSEPTSVPTSSPTRNYDANVEFFSFVSEEKALRTRGTPQNLAMRWLVDVDRTDVDVFDRLITARYALLVLHFAVSGEDGRADFGRRGVDGFPDPDAHECDWGSAVECKKALGRRRMVTLDLSNRGLEGGQLPEEIGIFYKLENLYMNKNRIGGTVPHGICGCMSLKVLELGENDLTGTLPACMGSLVSMNALDLSHNSLSGSFPEPVTGLRKLRILDLGSNAFIGTLPETLGDLRALTVFNVAGNILEGTVPKVLNHLPDLSSIHLDHNNFFGDLPFLCDVNMLPQLEELSLSNNKFNATFPTKALPRKRGGRHYKLRYLDVSENRVTGTLPFNIGYFEQLEHLDVSGCQFTGTIPDTLGPTNGMMSNLEYFDGGGNFFEGVLPVIGHPNTLTHLDLKMNMIMGTLPASYKEYQSLQYINLMLNPMGGFIPGDILGSMKSLSFVNFIRCGLGGTFPSSLGGLQYLEVLALGQNSIVGTLPSSLGGLKHMQKLCLSTNLLSGSIPTSLSGMQSLTFLELQHNRLTGTIPPEMSALEKLEEMFLQENELVGAFPNDVCDLLESGTLRTVRVDCSVECKCCSARAECL